MIRWCAYCQHYQGEQEPLDDYSITHDICEPCLASGAMENPVLTARVLKPDSHKIETYLAERGYGERA